jgi:hypothetical protein
VLTLLVNVLSDFVDYGEHLLKPYLYCENVYLSF